MKSIKLLLCASMLILAAPAVAAEDPTYEVPDATPVADAATAFTDSTNTSAVATTDAAFENGTSAQSAAADPEGPSLQASSATNVVGAGAALAEDRILAVDGLATAAAGWGVQRAENKRDEGVATGHAGLDIALAALGAGEQISGAAVSVVCGKPLVNDLADECDDGSLVAEANSTAVAFKDDSVVQAYSVSDRSGEMREAVLAIVKNFVAPPEDGE